MQSSNYIAGVKVNEGKNFIRNSLADKIEDDEIIAIIQLLFAFLGVELFRQELNTKEILFIENAVHRLRKHEPLQYILGEAWFYNLKFKVNKHVLIPRPETEELVDLMLKKLPLKQSLNILDIGTGSGCIPIALAKNAPLWKLHALDVSNDALTMARQNAEMLGVNINFKQGDILNAANLDMQMFDVIVSNPPYILPNEKAEMNPNVLAYEPHRALFVTDNDPLQFYKAIVQFASNYLIPNGFLFFETNTAYANNVSELLKLYGYKNETLIQDIHGNDRIVFAHKV